jgi:hypothetical protein
MATGNSPSGNGFPSPSPRGGKFPAPVPANARGERFLPIPIPERGIFLTGSPFPEHANAKSTVKNIISLINIKNIKEKNEEKT